MGQLARIADTLDRIAEAAAAREDRIEHDRPRALNEGRQRKDLVIRQVRAHERIATATEERNNLIAADSEERRRMFEKDQAARDHQFEAIVSGREDQRPLADVAIKAGWHIEGAACPLYQPHDHLPNDAVRYESDQTHQTFGFRVTDPDTTQSPPLINARRPDPSAKPRGFWHPKGPDCEGEYHHEHSGDGIFWTAGPRQGTTSRGGTVVFGEAVEEVHVGDKTVDERAVAALQRAYRATGYFAPNAEVLPEFRRELRQRGLDIVDLGVVGEAEFGAGMEAGLDAGGETLALAKWLHTAPNFEERQDRLAAYTSAKYATRDR